MTPQELKNSILQLAIQGKLVEQRAEEGTAEDLYKQIQAEKQALIKAGKIKKEKPFSTNASFRDYPFDIPDTWCFVRFGELMISRDSERIPVSTDERAHRDKVYDYYGASGVIDKIDDYLFDKELLLIGEDGANLLARSTPIAFLARGKYWVNNHAHVLDGCAGLNLEYICYYIKAISLAPYVTGTAQPKMNQENMNAIWVPLPPLAEQRRIVAKIEELLPLIERYEKAWSRLEDFNKRFPVDMQKSILQMAIQGKLVEQRPEEGTGEELYRRIQTEKQALIKAGKIKKEKPLPEITEDEIPFAIPESWKWVRFSELMLSMSSGPFGSMLHKADYIENGIPLVNPANIVNGAIIPSRKMMVSEETRTRLSSYILHSGMIVMGRRGEMGRCAVITEKEDGWLCGTGSFFMEPAVCLFVDYLSRFFSTPYAKQYLGGESIGTTMSNLNHAILSKMPVPLPPLAEQKRIVARLEVLLPLCEKLK